MEHRLDVVTTPRIDGKIVQEVFSVTNTVRERIMLDVMDTKEHQVRQALIALGWTPPVNAQAHRTDPAR